MEASIESIEELAAELEFFYEMSQQSKYTMEWVSNQIQEVGEKHGYVNVFPVSYLTKINLDLNYQLKIKKCDLLII